MADKELKPETIYAKFKRAYEFKKKYIDEARNDFEFALGKQWDDDDVTTLQDAKVRALTINKIRPNLLLLEGIESQNRTDFLAYPEGEEDSIRAEIATGLLKNVMKRCDGNYKLSEMFGDGNTCGESFIEPYPDYSEDMINGELKLRKWNFDQLYPEPKFTEYDMNDCNYICKLVQDLTEDDLITMYPEKEALIKRIGEGKLDTENFKDLLSVGEPHKQQQDYPSADMSRPSADLFTEEKRYDLIEYYYKKMVKRWFVLDRKIPKPKMCKDKEEAERYVNAMKQQDDMLAAEFQAKNPGAEMPEQKPSAVMMEKMIPEIWCAGMVANNIMANEPVWSYPRWKRYPFIPYFVFKKTVEVDNPELLTQGYVRGLKDLNREYNKRRTQELRILNSSANSGWLVEEGGFKDKKLVRKYGSTAGVIIEYKKTLKNMPIRLEPVQLSQGHAQLAAENNQDMKEATGINTDLLAMNENQASGRAIHLRQKQGMVMVQKIFDNFSQTKKILGKFILSQLGKLYDMDSAVKVMGEAFLNENFQRPKLVEQVNPITGQPEQAPVLDPMTGQVVMELDMEGVAAAFNSVLNDTSLSTYDVAVGEGSNNETVRYANYMTLLEMVQQGLPIPPEVLIEESMLSSAHKAKIANAIEQQQAMQQQAMAQSGKPPKKE
ncbi:MAG: hypothetical protein WC373_00770 [Smithella sp.]|jgi:hypothetical protein